MKNPLMMRIALYNDDVELVNPLGSSTGKHKLSMFYFPKQSGANSQIISRLYSRYSRYKN